MPSPAPGDPLVSIGALSRATGVGVETIRTWERRYGFPVPIRRPSGHRRYDRATMERLQLVVAALALGHRPGRTVALPEPELLRLLAVAGVRTQGAEAIADWIRDVEDFDAERLVARFAQSWRELGPREFVVSRAIAFLRETGERWERGDLGVRHEHFASERLRDFLVSRWRPLSDSAVGPVVVCATLSGELHSIGLQLAAVLLTLRDLRVVMLGADTPPEEVAQAVQRFESAGALIGSSLAAEVSGLAVDLRELVLHAPGAVSLAVGGGRCARAVESAGLAGRVHVIRTFPGLESWEPVVRATADVQAEQGTDAK